MKKEHYFYDTPKHTFPALITTLHYFLYDLFYTKRYDIRPSEEKADPFLYFLSFHEEVDLKKITQSWL